MNGMLIALMASAPPAMPSIPESTVKTAAMSPMVFALETAGAVSAIARKIPSSAPALDRSGQTRDVGTDDADKTTTV